MQNKHKFVKQSWDEYTEYAIFEHCYELLDAQNNTK